MEVRYTMVNADKGWIFGEWSEVVEDDDTTMGDIYRACRSEFGRCISKMYRDVKDGPPKVVGWVFQKRMQYEDGRDYYIREAWIEVA